MCGVVLSEILTGRQPFGGNTVADTLQMRVRDIGEARAALLGPEAPVVSVTAEPPKTSQLREASAGDADSGRDCGDDPRHGPAAGSRFRHLRFAVPLPERHTPVPAGSQAPSPDGKLLVFVASSAQKNSLWSRPVIHRSSVGSDQGGQFPFSRQGGAYFLPVNPRELQASLTHRSHGCRIPIRFNDL